VIISLRDADIGERTAEYSLQKQLELQVRGLLRTFSKQVIYWLLS
jgi:hypothetical protein